MILEKAYAKLNVNYSRIIGGFAIQSFRDLTGMPVMHHQTSTQTDEEFFNIVNNANERHWHMGVSCCNPGKHHDLTTGHAYTLLDAV